MNRQQRIWRSISRMMACVVFFCTTFMLMLPAATMEKSQCGLSEHTHSENCYNAVRIESHENNLDNDEHNDAYIADVVFTLGVLPENQNGDDLFAQIVDKENHVLASGRISGQQQDGEVLLEGSNGTYIFKNVELIEGSHELEIKLNGY